MICEETQTGGCLLWWTSVAQVSSGSYAVCLCVFNDIGGLMIEPKSYKIPLWNMLHMQYLWNSTLHKSELRVNSWDGQTSCCVFLTELVFNLCQTLCRVKVERQSWTSRLTPLTICMIVCTHVKKLKSIWFSEINNVFWLVAYVVGNNEYF